MLIMLNFSELLLGTESCLMAEAGCDDLFPVPNKYDDEVSELRALCNEKHTKVNLSEFPITYKETTFRVSLINSMADTVYVLRRAPNKAPNLDGINIHPTFKSRFLTPKLSGLIIIAGAFASGKTTTASAIINSRLSTLGGVAVTLEDPPEMPLEGRYEKGVCYQVWVQDGDFAGGLRSAARWTPSIIFLGEVRDSNSAMEALKASVNGVLVIMTLHGNSVVGALERLHALAAGGDGADSKDVASIMSNGLLGVLHQELNGEGKQKRLTTEMLWLGDGDLATVNAIRDKQWKRISERIIYQKNVLLSGGT